MSILPQFSKKKNGAGGGQKEKEGERVGPGEKGIHTERL